MREHLFVAGEIVPAPTTLYSVNRGRCYQAQRWKASDDQIYLMVGDEVPATSFVAATDSLE